MSHISDTAGSGGRHVAEDDLINDPDADSDVSWYGSEKVKYDRPHLPRREEQYVAAEHSRDRTRSPEHRDDRIRSHQDLRDRGGKTAEQVKNGVANMTEQVF